MKIYTKTGDDGTTTLVGGKRVPKDDVRVEAYGTIDELQAAVGLLASFIENKAMLDEIQLVLFKIGGYLANEKASNAGVTPDMIVHLEKQIDLLQENLPQLKSFIIPNGSKSASICHICRTVCRRAERRMTTMRNTMVGTIDNNAYIYINRLSDYFFLLARKQNRVKEEDYITNT